MPNFKGVIINLKHLITNYGETVVGYDQGMVNDREVRAAAGIMFLLGILIIFVGIGFNHVTAARVYILFVWFDLTVRIITPKYSAFMLLGRLFVRNQRPQYVGAIQKRFSWILGWFIFLPMLNWFVFHWDITFYKVMLCVLCLGLIFFESAFAICFGCMLYSLFTKKKAQNCSGDACVIKAKEPIQTFNTAQKIIVSSMIVALTVGIYLFLAKTESRTFFGEFLHEAVLTQAELEAENDAKLEAEFNAEDDDF